MYSLFYAAELSGLFEVTNCDIKFILHLAQQFICGLLQFNKAEPLLAEVFD